MNTRIKKLTSVVLIFLLLFSMTACSKTYTVESFRDALIKADVGASIANIKMSQNQVNYSRDGFELYVNYCICTDEYAALTWFQSFYERYEKCEFDGAVQTKLDKTFSYFTLNGETKDEQFSSLVGYYYGGWYCNKNTVTIVYTTIDSDNNRTEVDRILTQLKYPKPRFFQNIEKTTRASTVQSTASNTTDSTKSETTDSKKVYLVDLPGEGPLMKGTPYDIDGKNYWYSFGSDYEDSTYVWKLDYSLIGKKSGLQEFKTLKLKLSVGVSNDPPLEKRPPKANCVYIYADGKPIYENTNITAETKTQPLSFDITGCKELKIRICSYSVSPAIFEPGLCPE